MATRKRKKAKPKPLATQKDRIAERRFKVAQLVAQKVPQREIARLLNCSLQTVVNDISAVRKAVSEKADLSNELTIAQILSQFDEIGKEAWKTFHTLPPGEASKRIRALELARRVTTNEADFLMDVGKIEREAQQFNVDVAITDTLQLQPGGMKVLEDAIIARTMGLPSPMLPAPRVTGEGEIFDEEMPQTVFVERDRAPQTTLASGVMGGMLNLKPGQIVDVEPEPEATTELTEEVTEPPSPVRKDVVRLPVSLPAHLKAEITGSVCTT